MQHIIFGYGIRLCLSVVVLGELYQTDILPTPLFLLFVVVTAMSACAGIRMEASANVLENRMGEQWKTMLPKTVVTCHQGVLAAERSALYFDYMLLIVLLFGSTWYILSFILLCLETLVRLLGILGFLLYQDTLKDLRFLVEIAGKASFTGKRTKI